MKLRNGFVSNSSSSSFVLTNCKSTAQALRKVLDIMVEDDDWFVGNKHIAKANKFLDKVGNDFNEPILYPYTTNYETLIYQTDKGIRVDTSNNHNWWNYLDHYESARDYDSMEADEYYRVQTMRAFNTETGKETSLKEYINNTYGRY